MSIVNATIEYHEAFFVTLPNGTPLFVDMNTKRTVGFDNYNDARDAAMEVGCPTFSVEKAFVTAREWHNRFITHEQYETQRSPESRKIASLNECVSYSAFGNA